MARKRKEDTLEEISDTIVNATVTEEVVQEVKQTYKEKTVPMTNKTKKVVLGYLVNGYRPLDCLKKAVRQNILTENKFVEYSLGIRKPEDLVQTNIGD